MVDPAPASRSDDGVALPRLIRFEVGSGPIQDQKHRRASSASGPDSTIPRDRVPRLTAGFHRGFAWPGGLGTMMDTAGAASAWPQAQQQRKSFHCERSVTGTSNAPWFRRRAAQTTGLVQVETETRS